MNSGYPRRILFYRPGQIGDTVVALPAIWAIRRYFPTAFIALLYDQHTGRNYPPALRILPERGLFDEFFYYPATLDGTAFRKIIRLVLQIRHKQFDTLVYLAPSFRSKRQIWRDLVFFRLGGIKQFIGAQGILDYDKLAGQKPLPYLDHEADHLLSRLARSGIPVPPPGQGCMDLLLTEAEVNQAKDWLTNHLGLKEPRILVGMGVGGKYPAKLWPRERFAQLGRHLIDQLAGTPVIFGGPEDRELGNSLLNEWGAGANAAGELTVRQAAAALSFCRLYVGNDTGPMHLAAAVGTRCVGIFSGRHFPGNWHPYGPGILGLRARVACEGCGASDCSHMTCLQAIEVQEVIRACREALNNQG